MYFYTYGVERAKIPTFRARELLVLSRFFPAHL